MESTDKPTANLHPENDQRAGVETLSPAQAQQAIRLAYELREKDRERGAAIAAAHEVGVPREYLVTAIARLIEESEVGKQSKAKLQQAGQRVAIALAAVGLVAAVLIPIVFAFETMWVPLPSFDTAAPKPVVIPQPDVVMDQGGLRITNAPPVELHLLSIPPTAAFHAEHSMYVTRVTFKNRTGSTVDLYSVDEHGKRQLAASIDPTGTFTDETPVGTPWVATTAGADVGMFFPGSGDTTAMIGPVGDVSTTGYLRPVAYGATMPKSQPGQPEAYSPEILFVNISKRAFNLYAIDTDNQARWIARIESGQQYFVSDADAGDRWVVGDDNRRPSETFEAGYFPQVAVIG